MSVVDDYLAKRASPSQTAILQHVRKLIHAEVPEVGEKISYGVPTFTYKGTYLLYFAAYKNHMSIYPVGDDMVVAVGEQLAPFRSGRGTLRFTEDKPLPDALLKGIIHYRLDAINKK